MDTEKHKADQKLSICQVIKSALSAAFGVQSENNRERDFKKGSVKTFVITGLILAVSFVLVVIGLVRLVVHMTGS